MKGAHAHYAALSCMCTCVRVPGLPTEQGNEEEKINRDDEDMYEDSAGVGLKPQPLPGEEDALQLGVCTSYAPRFNVPPNALLHV